jgi:glycerol-3-phosphate dehydrogenase
MRPSLRQVADQTYDVIVIGGGINGSGIAREAALRGLSVLLLEKDDFCAGTSGRSSKLIHGGLRYLAHRQWRLVRESLREREALLQAFPRLVRPLPFLAPVYAGGPHGLNMLRFGMLLYDLFSWGKSMPRHRRLSKQDLLALEPGLSPEGLVGGFQFYDCQIVFPERLCIEVVVQALAAGAAALNHAEVTGLLIADGHVHGVGLRDTASGEEAEVRGRLVVNAAGPWVDGVCRLANPQAHPRVGGTVGSHLVLSRHADQPASHAISGFAQPDNRAFFVLPWREYWLIGTTDIRYQGDPDEAQASDAEVEYLLAAANRLLARRPLTRADVLYSYAGVRALPPEEGVSEGEITRRHIIHDHQREEGLAGLISIVGGKLTNFRELSREAVDVVARHLGRSRDAAPWPRHAWANLPTDPEMDVAAAAHEMEPAQVHHLATLYGPRLFDVLALADSEPSLRQRICPHNPDIGAQAVYAVQHELALTLADVLVRRTGIGLSRCLGLDCAPAAARLLAQHAGWDEERVSRELAEYRAYITRTYHPTAPQM